jgi:S-adenosylmethionine:tRNA ribosyltransferase-isomerase
LVIGPGREQGSAERLPRLVDSVLSGIHQAGESHYSLLGAFAPETLLARAETHARDQGYRAHEFGDACLVLAGPPADNRRHS